MSESIQRTPLYDEHVRLGGKVVEFAGWHLPVRYSGVVPEHNAVRSAAGLFDVSHMGELSVTGPEATKALQYLTCNDVERLKDGAAQYNAFLTFSGGVVDDIIIYRQAEDRYLVCVNASNAEKAFKWCIAHNKYDARIDNVSKDFAQVALQGPRSEEILALATGQEAVRNLKYFHHQEFQFLGAKSIIARTGYTGEDGFELFVPPASAVDVWKALLETGESHGLIPCGLGARDSLRLEACYPLHGHELGEDITAYESGLGWIVKLKKKEFIGRSALAAQKEQGVGKKLVGFEVTGKGIVREESALHDQNGKRVGSVTSGTKTPTCDKALGLALVETGCDEIGTELVAQVRSREVSCEVVETPFYKRDK